MLRGPPSGKRCAQNTGQVQPLIWQVRTEQGNSAPNHPPVSVAFHERLLGRGIRGHQNSTTPHETDFSETTAHHIGMQTLEPGAVPYTKSTIPTSPTRSAIGCFSQLARRAPPPPGQASHCRTHVRGPQSGAACSSPRDRSCLRRPDCRWF
jgi:hypothetical protein